MTPTIEQLESRTDSLLADYRAAQSAVDTERKGLIAASNHLDAVSEACDVVQHVAAEIQAKAHSAIAAVVSKCLEAVFDEPYELKIAFERKRGKTEARIYFEREGLELSPDAVGGGVIDVAAFALRLACLLMHRPQLRPVMVLDEPFKFVSANYIPRVRLLLDGLSEEFGVQFILVTHIAGLIDDEAIILD